MKRNGQALVEFIVILPILIIVLLGIIDFGLIIYEKNNLEGTLEEVVDIWENKEDISEVDSYLNKVSEEIDFNLENNNETIKLELNKAYDPITPGLNLILDNPYIISVSRVIYNE